MKCFLSTLLLIDFLYLAKCTSDDCPEGWYLTNGECKACSHVCKTCTYSETSCRSCYDGYYFSGVFCWSCNTENCKICKDSKDTCTICKEGYYLNSNTCISCVEPCKSCSSSTQCDLCKDGYYLSLANCIQCKQPCKTCSDDNICTSCIDNYFLVLDKCYECNYNCKTKIDDCQCDSCNDGFYLFNFQCLNCDSNCKTCSNSENNCLSCEEGYYLTSNNSCRKCNQYCKTCSDENICTSCIDDYFLLLEKCYQCNYNCKTLIDNCKCISCIAGYYFNKYQCLKCGPNCKRCSGTADKCISCDESKYLLNNRCYNCEPNCKTCSINANNCTSCGAGKYLDKNSCFNCKDSCDNRNNIQIETKVIEDEEEIQYYDELLGNIETIFISEYYDISKLEIGEDNFFKNEKMKITLTTTVNENNKLNDNIASIDFNSCETLLRSINHMSLNESLYMMKVIIIQKNMMIPKIEYSIYRKINETNLIKLNLSICQKTKISLLIPLEITENLDKLNTSSGYFNDICYTSTSKYGTDIILKDRQNEYIKENKAVCQDECIFSDYNYTIKKVNCSCEVKEMPLSFVDMNINKTKLYENFMDIKNIANIRILICYKNLFSKIGAIYNIGSYIIIAILLFHIISFFYILF